LDTIEITPARVDDAQQILDLQRAAYRSVAEHYGVWDLPPLTQTLDELIAEYATHSILVARHSPGIATTPRDPIVGSVRARVVDGTAYVGRLAVAPDMHARGIGRRLLWGIERSTAPVHRYELFTGGRSDRSLRMYERAGYRRIRAEQQPDTVTLVYMEKVERLPAPLQAGAP
jgi:ribosomal protein S18 acetylase RimI-like enzyme